MSQDNTAPSRPQQAGHKPKKYTGKTSLCVGSTGTVETFDGTLKDLHRLLESERKK